MRVETDLYVKKMKTNFQLITEIFIPYLVCSVSYLVVHVFLSF
jgi:hypothetical protein